MWSTKKNIDVDERVERAVNNFESGYNCSQAVFLSFTDIIDVDLNLAKNVSLGFGGGMGKLEKTCGTFSALVLLAGLRYPVKETDSPDARDLSYHVIQRMAKEFEKINHSTDCSLLTSQDMTKLVNNEKKALKLAIRPCSKYVADAARLAGRMMNGEFEGE